MLNYIWAFMILIGIVYGAFSGHMADISGGILDSAREAVELCITMLGIVGFWTGLMEVAKESGLVAALTRLLSPLLHFLFPRIPKEHKAYQYISLNFIANILGLGWAATPAGLKAMEAMAGKFNQNAASDFGVAALSFLTGARGAWLNVKINLPGVKDEELQAKFAKAEDMLKEAEEIAAKIYGDVEKSL